MMDNTSEQLSALMDDEYAAAEAELLLCRLSKDADLRERWQRYHLISDALKNNIPEVVDPDFTERVGKAIEANNPLQTNLLPIIPSWYKPIIGFALAASVAVIALVGLQFSQQSEPLIEPEPPLASTIAPERRPAQRAMNDAVQSRLNNYVVNHNEYASMNSVHGMLPYVRIVGVSYEPNR